MQQFILNSLELVRKMAISPPFGTNLFIKVQVIVNFNFINCFLTKQHLFKIKKKVGHQKE